MNTRENRFAGLFGLELLMSVYVQILTPELLQLHVTTLIFVYHRLDHTYFGVSPG